MNTKKSNLKPQYGMVDISAKTVTNRTAKAVSTICFSKKGFQDFVDVGSPKGDVLETARVAGIMAAKNTSGLIPFCHPLSIECVKIRFDINKSERKIDVYCEVSCYGKTGVEMEALSGVSVAALTVYDMMKWSDKKTFIKEVKLISKTGGKSGNFCRN